jgi:hypothetical protein
MSSTLDKISIRDRSCPLLTQLTIKIAHTIVLNKEYTTIQERVHRLIDFKEEKYPLKLTPTILDRQEDDLTTRIVEDPIMVIGNNTILHLSIHQVDHQAQTEDVVVTESSILRDKNSIKGTTWGIVKRTHKFTLRRNMYLNILTTEH